LLLTLSIATSIDAFTVGLFFAFLEVNVILALGYSNRSLNREKVGGIVGKRTEIAGGLILTGIELRILLEHML